MGESNSISLPGGPFPRRLPCGCQQSAALQALYPAITIGRGFFKILSHHNDEVVLKDATVIPVNKVHYYDKVIGGFRQPGGSSLELRDPLADNSKLKRGRQ